MSAWLVWFLVGVGFLLAELALPGFILIFFCLGSWFAMLLVLLAPGVSTSVQIAVFLGASLASLFTLRKWGMKTFGGRSELNQDKQMDDKVGKSAVVTRAICPPTAGEVKCLGSFWRAVADAPIAEGRAVIIEAPLPEDHLTLKVKPAENWSDTCSAKPSAH